MVARIMLSFFLGLGCGYAFFYFRFQDRGIVLSLRETNATLTSQVTQLHKENDELRAQNAILKESVLTSTKKHGDLANVVSELSRYYYLFKQGSAKVADLALFFSGVNEDLERHLNQDQSKVVQPKHPSDDAPDHIDLV
ncbi:MAG: hypothetical protein NZL83_04135 [Candidatus Absconditabacterales bacterium]|nr:hypothetical protein [Candidatus Absconditabacterales bacterium]